MADTTTKQATKGKATKGKATKPSFRDDLTPRQVRVLAVLAKAKEPITRAVILERISDHNLGNSLGHRDEAGRKKRDAEIGYRSLLTLSYVTEAEKDGKAVYGINAKGKAALAKALEAAKKGGE